MLIIRMAKKELKDALHRHPDFSPLFAVLRAELGRDWRIYNEFLEEYRDALRDGENLTPWANRMEPLISNQAACIAHQGVLFLLKDLYSRLGARYKTSTISKSPSPHANDSSPQNPVEHRENPVLAPTQRSTTDSESESTQTSPPESHSSAAPVPSSAPATSAPTGAAVSEEQSHTNSTQQ